MDKQTIPEQHSSLKQGAAAEVHACGLPVHRQLATLPTRLRHRLAPLDIGFGCLALVFVMSITTLFVSSERIFYWSDYAGYQDIAYGIVAHYRVSLLSAVRAIVESMGSDYNAIFSIPLVPWLVFFGESRLVYVLALAVVYLLTFTLMLGLIAVELIPYQTRAVFWSTVGIALLTPFAWVPTLRGYPDTGAAACIALAVWIYVRAANLPDWWQIPAIGVLIAGAMLFRRHFAYAGSAFFAAATVHSLLAITPRLRRQPREALRQLGRAYLRLALIGLAALIVLAIFGRSLLRSVLTINYNELYASYLDPFLVVVSWYPAAYGWAAWFCALLGYAVALYRRTVRVGASAFVALFGALALVQWSALVRQIGEHYTLHFTPLVVLGQAALLWTIWACMKGFLRVGMLAAAALFLITNMVFSLAATEVGDNSAIRPLFAPASPPLTRPDYNQVVQLVGFLRRTTTPDEPIYVVASSELMNRGLLRNAERALYGWDHARLDIMEVPHIDSRDFLPLEMLLQARYVVVVEPFQHHLAVKEQDVIKVVFDVFEENLEIARDFAPLQFTASLDHGAVVRVYQRRRSTSLPVALRTLDFIQRAVQERPGGQLDWMGLSGTPRASVSYAPDGSYLLTKQGQGMTDQRSASFLYMGSLPDRIQLSATTRFGDTSCAGAVLRVSGVDSNNQIRGIAEIARRPGEPADAQFTFARQDAVYLLLEIANVDQSASASPCSLRLEHLRVDPQ